jgi:DNA-binding protein HU-beta
MATKKKAAATGSKPMSKTQLIQAIADAAGDVSKKQVKQVLEALQNIGYKQLKKAGVFTLPGFAKFRVRQKKAVKGGEKWFNPLTQREEVRKARPASKVVRVRAVKAVKDAVA